MVRLKDRALDDYQLPTQVGELYVVNMVDTTYSLVARCPKRYLPWAGN